MAEYAVFTRKEGDEPNHVYTFTNKERAQETVNFFNEETGLTATIVEVSNG